jgi:hypothetical protein
MTQKRLPRRAVSFFFGSVRRESGFVKRERKPDEDHHTTAAAEGGT